MPTSTLHYTLTYPLFREAFRAHARHAVRTPVPPLLVLLTILPTLAVVLLLLLSVANDNVRPGLSFLVLPRAPLSILLVLFIFCQRAQALFRCRLHWTTLRHLARPHTLAATDTHLTESWDGIDFRFTWSDVTHLVETPSTLLLITTIGFIIVPKTATPTADLQLLQQLANAHLHPSPPTRAFPVLPTPDPDPHPESPQSQS